MDNFETTEPDNSVDTTLAQFTSSPLPDGDNHYFHIRTVDNAGNASKTLHTGPFHIDATPPAGGYISINNGAEISESAEVTLTLSASDIGCGMSHMQFSNNNINWADPVEYATSANWSVLPGEGTRTVYARFSDAAENWTAYDIQDDISIKPESAGRLILIAGGGAAETNTLWPTTRQLVISVYRVFDIRGFIKRDIYFMIPAKGIDFNGDGIDDHIVDCPPENEDRNLTMEDVRDAITGWAVQNYTPVTPLYIWLIDHGYPDDGEHGPCFMVSPGQLLYADDLNEMLNTYEEATDGQVILINESCYSGQFMEPLKKQGRIIITATKDKVVNYDNQGTNSFTNFIIRYLFENNNILQAFGKAARNLRNSSLTNTQIPCLDDNGDGKYDDTDGVLASEIKLGGNRDLGLPWPEILSAASIDHVGTTLSFTVTTNAYMKRVWASVQPPNYAPDMSGDYQEIDLEKFDLYNDDDDLTYEGVYDGFNQTGKYVITFYANDLFGNNTISEPLEFMGKGVVCDVNYDKVVNLADAVLILKILTESDDSDQITVGADIGKNNKVGMEEAVYVLQVVGGLRD